MLSPCINVRYLILRGFRWLCDYFFSLIMSATWSKRSVSVTTTKAWLLGGILTKSRCGAWKKMVRPPPRTHSPASGGWPKMKTMALLWESWFLLKLLKNQWRRMGNWRPKKSLRKHWNVSMPESVSRCKFSSPSLKYVLWELLGEVIGT